MIQAKIYDIEGKETSRKTLDSEVFEIKPNEVLLKLAVTRYLASLREPIAKTKTRAERRGGGRKPWRQKGTGRARAGSKRSSIWRKGGVVFGPTGKETFAKRIPKKALKKAILMSLSAKAKDGRIIILKDIKLERPETKKMKSILDKLPVEKRILLISLANPILLKSVENIPLVLSTLSNQLNAYDILVADYLVILESALDKISKVYVSLRKKSSSTKPARRQGGVSEDKKAIIKTKKPKKAVSGTSKTVPREQQ